MKQTKIKFQYLGLLSILILTMALGLVGCGSGNDSAPPNDPAYYKGEMKGKGGQKAAAGQSVD